MSKNKYLNVNNDSVDAEAIAKEATSEASEMVNEIVEETTNNAASVTKEVTETVEEVVDKAEDDVKVAAKEDTSSKSNLKMDAVSKKKKKKLSLSAKRSITGYLFIMPWLVGFCIYYIRSLFMTISFSFSEVTVKSANAVVGSSGGKGYTSHFNGFDNFIQIFGHDTKFNQKLVLSLEDILIDVPLILTFALLMAILLNQKFFGRTIFRAIFFIPVIMSCAAISDSIAEARQAAIGGISSTSASIAEANSSAVDLDYYVSLFKDIGLPASIIDYVVAAVGRIADVVNLAGVQIVIFIAALQSIPSSLYEVAKIEGATTYETFWKVTFPMVMPHIITCLVYTVVDAFSSSEVVQYSYDTIFENGMHYDYGSAMALVSMIIVCVLLTVVVALIQRKTFYYN